MGDDDFDAAWDKMSDAANRDEAHPADPPPSTESSTADATPLEIDPGPPVRVLVVIRADSVPVAPWAQGWRIAAAGPQDGLLSMQFDHDADASPVAQLAAITGLLGTLRAAQLDLVWWTIQTRGPFPGEESSLSADIDQELSDLLSDPPADA